MMLIMLPKHIFGPFPPFGELSIYPFFVPILWCYFRDVNDGISGALKSVRDALGRKCVFAV